MRLIDVTEESEGWLGHSDPERFLRWLHDSDPAVQVGFSILGGDGDDAWRDSIATGMRRVAPARDLVLDRAARQQRHHIASEGLERVASVLDDDPPDVDVYLLAGLGWSNASQGWWASRGLAFVFVEQFLDPRGAELLGLPPDDIAVWLAHEVGHAIHYAAHADELGLAHGVDRPLGFWKWLDDLPLQSRLLDEGRASQLCLRANPEVPVEQALGMTPSAVAWLDEFWPDLYRARRLEWSMERSSPAAAWRDEALYAGADEPAYSYSWTLRHPPTRWGYYVGLQLTAVADATPEDVPVLRS